MRHRGHNQTYYQKHREEIRERKKEYYLRKRDEILGRNRDWNQRHQEHMNKMARERRGTYASGDAVVSVNFNVKISFD